MKCAFYCACKGLLVQRVHVSLLLHFSADAMGGDCEQYPRHSKRPLAFYLLLAGAVSCIFLPILFGILYDPKARVVVPIDYSHSHRVIKALHNNGLLMLPLISDGPSGTVDSQSTTSACLVAQNDTLLVQFFTAKRMDVVNIITGERSVVKSKLLQVSNAAAVEVSGEIWLTCGFLDNTKHNSALEHIIVISTQTWEVSLGPKILQPRRRCEAFVLTEASVDQHSLIIAQGEVEADNSAPYWTEDVVCMLGPVITQSFNPASNFDCYSRRANAWFSMPNLPESRGTIRAQRLFKKFPNNVQDQLVLASISPNSGSDSTTNVYEFSLRNKAWRLLFQYNARFWNAGFHIARQRYALFVGGKGMVRTKFYYRSAIEVCDGNTKSCETVNTQLQTGRTSVITCFTQDNEVLFVCGEKEVRDTAGDCEVFEAQNLLY